MDTNDQIAACYNVAVNYPDLARRLAQIGVESYTVDTASGALLYRFREGKNTLHPGSTLRDIKGKFDKQKTIQAIRDNQQGKTDYPGFMDAIAEAGVRFYEATLNGPKKRVTYIGSGGSYEEMIPL